MLEIPAGGFAEPDEEERAQGVSFGLIVLIAATVSAAGLALAMRLQRLHERG